MNPINLTKSLLNWPALALVSACALALAPQCQGQFNLFLRVDGVPGESTTAGRDREIVATAFSHDVAMPIVDGRSGHPVFSGLGVTKFVDLASPLLMLRCAQGTAIPTVVLSVQSTTPTPLDVYRIVLRNARVTRLTTGGDVSGRSTETVTFDFERIEITYISRRPDGSPGSPVTSCWDRRTMTGC